MCRFEITCSIKTYADDYVNKWYIVKDLKNNKRKTLYGTKQKEKFYKKNYRKGIQYNYI